MGLILRVPVFADRPKSIKSNEDNNRHFGLAEEMG